MTNAGKKEQGQINQLLDKEVKEGEQSIRPAEGRVAPRGHSPRKGRKHGK
jgi:hypothetical protein